MKPPHPGPLGGIGHEDRGAAIDAVLPVRAAARSGAGREHDRVGTTDDVRHLVDGRGFEVDHHRSAPSARTGPTWSGFRISATARSPDAVNSLIRCLAILPCPPAMTIASIGQVQHSSR